MEYILQTNEVSKDFSGKMAVDHVSIKINNGTATYSGMLGTTLIKKQECEIKNTIIRRTK